jgi:hypothetical protein
MFFVLIIIRYKEIYKYYSILYNFIQQVETISKKNSDLLQGTSNFDYIFWN